MAESQTSQKPICSARIVHLIVIKNLNTPPASPYLLQNINSGIFFTRSENMTLIYPTAFRDSMHCAESYAIPRPLGKN